MLKEKGDTSKFVAISCHAPSKDKALNKAFCDLMKAFIEDVAHNLPVLVGGDFIQILHIGVLQDSWVSKTMK